MLRTKQLDQTRTALRRVAGCNQRFDKCGQPGGDIVAGQAHVGEARDLSLAHGDATDNLGKVFAKTDADDQLLDLTQMTGHADAVRIGGELTNGLEISGEPGEAMG